MPPRRHSRHHDPVPHQAIPEFHGFSRSEIGITWIQSCEEFFDFTSVPVDHRVKLAAKHLHGRAAVWWQDLKTERLRIRKPKIQEWNKFRKHFVHKFVPKNWSTAVATNAALVTATANHRHHLQVDSYSSRRPAPSLFPVQQSYRRQSTSASRAPPSRSAVPGGASSSTFQPPPVTPPTDSPSSSAISGLASSSMPVPPSPAAHFSTSAVLASCHKVKDNGQEYSWADKEIPFLFDKSAFTFDSLLNSIADTSGDVENPLTFTPLTFVEEDNVETIMENIQNVYDGPPIFDDESGLIDFVLPVYDTEPVEETCKIFAPDGEDYEPRFSEFDLTYDVPCLDGDVDFVSITTFHYFISNDSYFVSCSLKPPSYRLSILSHIRTADIFEAKINAMLINFTFPGDELVVASLILLAITLLQIRGRIFSKRGRMMENILHISVFIFI